jgi:hypothetical protein
LWGGYISSQRTVSDERVGVKSRYPFALRRPHLGPRQRLRHNARRKRREEGRARSSNTHPSAAFVADNNAPLIDERAATRGRSATEGGDERVGAKKA